MSPASSFATMYRQHPLSQNQASSSRTTVLAHSSQQAQGSSSTIPTTKFKAPAHKHAHHLHSIPPREKSTRTLILDHMLWIHARTRLRQARAELGMSGILPRQEGSPQIMAQLPPLEEEDPSSDGEDVVMVKYSAQDRQRTLRFPEEDDYTAAQNLSQAQALRLQADGIEKVLTAMVDQPPDVQPPLTDDDTRAPLLIGAGELHYPNGVRFRLALCTLINDLFARDVPTPLTSTSSNTPALKPRPGATPSTSPVMSSVQKHNPPTLLLSPTRGKDPDADTMSNGLPSALAPLSTVSNYSYRELEASKQAGSDTQLPSISSFVNANHINDTLPPILSQIQSREAIYQSNLTSNAPTPLTNFSAPTPSPARSQPTQATSRVLSLYKAGADPQTANSPPSLRCPRHLHHSCAICAAVKSPTLPTTTNAPSNSGVSSSPLNSRGAMLLGNNGSRSKTPGIVSLPGTGLAAWKTGAGIGAGLSKPGIHGTALRRRTISYHTTSHPTAKDAGPCASGGKLADFIPRFLRLSALVAMELGSEAKDKEDESVSDDINLTDAENAIEVNDESVASARARLRDIRRSANETPFAAPLPPSSSAMRVTLSQDTLNTAFRPTRDWYALLSGLLTRAVLEGYLSRGWKGSQGMECLMGVGLGVGVTSVIAAAQQIANSVADNSKGLREGVETDEFDHLDPDEFPSLLDSAVILFPTLRWVLRAAQMGLDVVEFESRQKARDGAEGEYEQEMAERLSEFLNMPDSTPDLSTHFEDLAYKFPAEPVERAAVRFCEAVTRWRGRPELENYKKPSYGSSSSTGGRSAAEPSDGDFRTKPNIERYFTRSSSASAALVLDRKNPPKRVRSPDSGSSRDTDHLNKRLHRLSPPRNDVSRIIFNEEDGRRDDNDWIGPYGI